MRGQQEGRSIVAICNDAGRDDQEEDWQRHRGLHQSHHLRGLAELGHEPRSPHALHPRAEIRRGVGNPQRPEQAVSER